MLACNIADSFAKYRWCPNIIGPQSGGAVKDLPVHLFETMGQIQAKIPTEVLVTDRREFELAEEGFITLTMRKDSDNAAFFSANSVQKPKHFPGKDAETNYKLGTQLPYLFIINRLAHYIKVLQREQLGSWKERSDLERELNTWIRQYVADQENPPADVRSRKPLRAAKVEVMDKSSVPVLIPRNEQFTTNAGEIRVDEVLPSDAKKEEPPPCTFTLCRDIWLLPVRLEQIENRSTTRNGVINITFSVAPGTDFRTLDLNKLRFWLGNDDNYTRDQLYLWFCEYLQGADLTVGEQHIRLPEFMLKAVGFEPQDAMLPWPKNVHSGYRILQEYFCYPDAFLFFDLCGCPALPDGLQAEFFTLQLRFSRPLPVDIRLRRDSLRLYCAPAINLFIHHAEAITLDNRRADYPLVPSRHYPQHYDVFSVNSVVSQVQDMFRKKDLGRPVSTQAARQWPAFESFSHQMEYSRKREVVYWHHRTKTSLFHRGFDHTLAFIHADGSYPSDESLLSNEVVSVSLTCTNRELPSQIRSGDITGTTGKNAAVASFRNITRPTQPLWPVIDGSLHWSLLSAMNLNYLSLLDTDALKQVIANFDRHAIHHPQTARLSQQKLDAIERLETRPVDRLFTGIPVRGLASTLYLHPEPFVCEGEMYLLGTVLSHFLSLYASVNSFHMLTVVNTESQETWKWTERIGQHPLI
ncbi:type VI secretion system baseplate subunit TssF [Escherichia coli]|nr:type VI secretion system baseplate subunit TssF [Escherichia coli]EFD5324508.1 type VI secretion system baseplate subunit TssF [Escherichia coli]EFD7748935.1 type VI secretion system baseplate subunit TssF [Escherichia coli]